ncbi:HPr family phosphocarrier protein [Alkalibacillus haloalkaliphilus]|uniref:HPr family phosphocarrier protein n=1 Tax=Alkalibacillus haloalkaliphilus TaxID=94136 RepID=UPI0029364CB6|nr:HPr family phosphocarrier protein [Alkalibacillus haloalkaliphilus]MDV2582199.1 HPr family phosphocarrier protein [Alkalibacillus haloalkaliphilus]
MSGQLSKTVSIQLNDTQTIMELSQLIQKYDAEIFLQKNVQGSIREANLKSILGLINLQLQGDDQVKIICDGPDAESALQAIEDFLQAD